MADPIKKTCGRATTKIQGCIRCILYQIALPRSLSVETRERPRDAGARPKLDPTMGKHSRGQSTRGSVSDTDTADAARAAANDDEVALRALLQRVSPDARWDFQVRLQIDGQHAATPLAKLPLLLIAIQSGATDCVALLLESRADPSVKVENPGMSTTAFDSCFAFPRATRRPWNLDAAHLIIEARVDPNKFGRAPDGCTELMMACQEGEYANARFLLDHKADANLGKTNGSTALFKAAQNGHLEICRLLVHARANVDAPFCSGCTPLGAACVAGHEAIARLLLSVGANARVVASDGLTPSDMARTNGHRGVVSLLAAPLIDTPQGQPLLLPGTRVTVCGLQAKPELNGASATILEFDRTSGRYATAFRDSGNMLGLKPVNVVPNEANTTTNSAITASSPVRPQEVWSLLTAVWSRMIAGSTPPAREGNAQDGHAAHNAVQWVCNLVRRGDFDLAHAFPTPLNQQKGAGMTMPLLAFSAAMMRKRNPSGPEAAANLVAQPGLVRALLESKANVNARTESGATALHVACSSGLAEHIRVLLEHGADVNATDGHGAPGLMLLMQSSRIVTDEWRLECLGLLAGSKQLEIDQKDDADYTSFLAAVEWGRGAEVLHALLAHGADVNAQTAHPGFTALAAASAGNTVVAPSIVKLLLDAKADATTPFTLPTMPHAPKQTPREWAAEQRRNDVVDIFDAHCGFNLVAHR